MPRRERRSRIKRRRTSLKATNVGPILALSATILSILGVIALIVFVALPALLPKLGISYNPPWQPTPTPRPTIRPTPTPHPVTRVDPAELQHEVVLTGYDEYKWFADPYAWGDTLVFTAGRLVNDAVCMDALFKLDMQANTYEKISAERTNDSYIYPVLNGDWLAYFDSKAEGGGVIRAIRLSTGEAKVVKQVYVGQPKLYLDGDVLAWMERTGSRMDKLFACDLTTMENVAVHLFNNTAYGQSAMSMCDGEIIYADADPNVTEAELDEAQVSAIYSVQRSVGKTSVYTPDTYVHDPMTNGRQWIWRNGSHGVGDDLYWTQSAQRPKLLAEDIVEYGLSDTFAAYSKDESIHVFFFDDGSTTVITPPAERERAQLLGVSNGVVIWMDVTSRERDIMKYARVE